MFLQEWFIFFCKITNLAYRPSAHFIHCCVLVKQKDSWTDAWVSSTPLPGLQPHGPVSSLRRRFTTLFTILTCGHLCLNKMKRNGYVNFDHQYLKPMINSVDSLFSRGCSFYAMCLLTKHPGWGAIVVILTYILDRTQLLKLITRNPVLSN